jgi:lipopolysaccharide export LptBFGC system permease protein LptF
MRTLDRYLLRTFFFNYLACLFVLISIYVILDLFFNLDEFTEGDAGFFGVLQNIADYYAYNIPLYFSQVSGVITLVAACVTLARLQWANETTAILASGVSLHRLAAPIVVAGFCMNVLLVADFELVLPAVAPKLARNRDDVELNRVYDLWFLKDADRLLSAQRFRPSTGEIRGLYVVEVAGPRKRLAGAITADIASWDAARRRWNLTNGRHYDLSGSDVATVKPTRLDYYESQLDPDELVLRKMAAWTQFLSTRQLNKLATQDPTRRGLVDHIKHSRFTQPINNMILLLLGISFFMHRLPESVLTQAVKALIVCALVVMIAFAGQHLVGAVGSVIGVPIHPALPAWLPIFLFGPLAVLLLDNVKT